LNEEKHECIVKTLLSPNNEFKGYMKVEGTVLEDIFDYLFDVETGKFLSEKEKKYLLELFKEWDPEHFKQLDEDFDDYSDNDGLEVMNLGRKTLKLKTEFKS